MAKVEERIENSLKKLIALEMKSNNHNPQEAINQVHKEIKDILPQNEMNMVSNAA